MTITVIDPTPTRLRIARAIAVVGMAGLSLSAFLDQGKPFGRPVDFLSEPSRYYHDAEWVLLTPFLLAAALLVMRIVAAALRGRGSRVGWVALAFTFLLFIIVDIALWGEISPDLHNYGVRGWQQWLKLSVVLAFLAAPTFASACLIVAPARVRLAACVGIAGIWSLVLTGGLALVRPDHATWLWLSAAASLFFAAGGVVETVLLWRRGAPPEESP